MSDAFWIAMFAMLSTVATALLMRENRKKTIAEDSAKSYKEVAHEAVVHLETIALQQPDKPVPHLVPVVPEHSSPTTKEQRQNAELQTIRARLVAATLAMGLPVRAGSEPARDDV